MTSDANTADSIGGTCGIGIQAIFYSSDGGVTWGYTCAPSETAYGLNCTNPFLFGSDPAVNWDVNGNVYLEHMMLCTANFMTFQYAIVTARSTNGGVTWNGQGIVINSWPTPNRIEDKNFYAIDNNPGSPFFGRHYTCWDRNNNEKSAYSTNAGATWTEVDLPPSPSTGASVSPSQHASTDLEHHSVGLRDRRSGRLMRVHRPVVSPIVALVEAQCSAIDGLVSNSPRATSSIAVRATGCGPRNGR